MIHLRFRKHTEEYKYAKTLRNKPEISREKDKVFTYLLKKDLY